MAPATELRSWVQIPPGPSFPVVQLRYWFKLIFDECRTNSTAMPMPYPTLRKRWGSLAKDKRTINLNVNLLKAPDDVMDYIILHELCHVKINDHSHHYWDLVHKYIQSYQDKIDWLNINTRVLV